MVTMITAKVILFVGFVGSCYCEIPHDVGIIGGHQITIEKVPFMVSLRLNATYHWCGGSIINERFVLTAAHCIVPNRTFKVLVGTDRVDNDGKLYDIEKIIIHEKYSNVTYNFDVCLIKLTEPLTFGPKVAAINLADHKVKVHKNTMLNVTGWGSTGHNPYSSHLLQVAIPTVTRSRCQLLYLPYKFIITPQMICAGKRGQDSCQGDSGGPLTKGNIQVGVTSFGLGCGEVPGVYVKISTVLPWIRKTITENTETAH